MNVTLILLCACGLLLHFLSRYGEAARTTKVGLVTYVRQDIPGWLSAVVGSLACMLMLDSLPAALGLGPVVATGGLMKILALSAGYAGSSLAAKVPALLSGKGAR
jgi:hypothetical protein